MQNLPTRYNFALLYAKYKSITEGQNIGIIYRQERIRDSLSKQEIIVILANERIEHKITFILNILTGIVRS